MLLFVTFNATVSQFQLIVHKTPMLDQRSKLRKIYSNNYRHTNLVEILPEFFTLFNWQNLVTKRKSLDIFGSM